MISAEDEVYIWEDILHSVSNVLSDIGDGRSQVKETWDEDTPSFDRIEWILSDAYDFIEGRLQELDPTYSERTAWSSKAKAQASKALSYGINFQAFKGLAYDETDKALNYIEEHGLVSMNYEETREALRKFRDSERQRR